MLSAAADLYRGEVAAGESVREPVYQQWLDGERSRLRALAATAFQKLGEMLLVQGDLAAAIAAGRRLLEIDPLCEAAHRVVIAGLARSGDRSGALAHYGRCRELLRRELAVAPDPATEALAAAIRQGTAPPTAPPAASEPALPGFRSNARVVVIPLRDAGEETQSYFADGLTEDIIDGLSAWRWMPVIGRATALSYRDSGIDPLAIAAELGARYAVTGSVRRSGEEVRLSVELIAADDGRQIWSGRIVRPFSAMFEAQEEMTRAIVAHIEPEIERAEEQHAGRKAPGDLTAWDHILRARREKTSSGFGYGTDDGNRKAMEHLENALRIDAASSRAHSLLAECHWHAAIQGWSPDPQQSIETALSLANKAVVLDDGNWLAFTYVGVLKLFGHREFSAALASLRRAVELNPSSSLARHGLGCCLVFAGEPAPSLIELDIALTLDPRYLNRATILADKSLAHLLLGNEVEAVALANQAVAWQPDYVRGLHRQIAALAAAGQRKEAQAALARVRRLQPDLSINYIRATYPFVRTGDAELFERALSRAGLHQQRLC